jgi:hypothetical protein
MSSAAANTRPIWGFSGFVFAIVALILVVLPMTSMLSAPPQDTATSIGEIAAEIRNSAIRSLTGGEKPAPVVQEQTRTEIIASYLFVIGPVLAGLAAILGAVALLRREPQPLPMMAIGLGISAVVLQYAFVIALVIAGVCLMVAILNNLGDILGT